MIVLWTLLLQCFALDCILQRSMSSGCLITNHCYDKSVITIHLSTTTRTYLMVPSCKNKLLVAARCGDVRVNEVVDHEKRKGLDKVYTVDTGRHLAHFTEPARTEDDFHPLSRCVGYITRNDVQNLCPWPVAIAYTTHDNEDVESEEVLWINGIMRPYSHGTVMYHPLLPPAKALHPRPPASTYFCMPDEESTKNTADIVVKSTRGPQGLMCRYENLGSHGYALVDGNGNGAFYTKGRMRNGAGYIKEKGVLIPGEVHDAHVRDNVNCDIFAIPLPQLLPVTKKDPPASLYVPVVPRTERDSSHCVYLLWYSDPRLCMVVNDCFSERVLHTGMAYIPSRVPARYTITLSEYTCKIPMYHSHESTYQSMHRRYKRMMYKTLTIDASPQHFVPTLYNALQERKRFFFFRVLSKSSLKTSKIRVKFKGQTGEDVTGLSVGVAAMMDNEIGLFCQEEGSNITSMLKAEDDPLLDTYKSAICSSGLDGSKDLLFPNPTSAGVPLLSKAVSKYAEFIGSFMGLALNWVVMTRIHHQQFSAAFLMPQLGNVDPIVYRCLLDQKCRPSVEELKSSFMGRYIQDGVNQWTRHAPKTKTTLTLIINSIGFLEPESETLLEMLAVNYPVSFPSSVFSSMGRGSTVGDTQPAFRSEGFGAGFEGARNRFGIGRLDEEMQLPGQAEYPGVGERAQVGRLAPPSRDRSRISSLSSHFDDVLQRYQQHSTTSSEGSFSSEISAPCSDEEFQNLVDSVIDTFFEIFSAKQNLFQERADGKLTAFGQLKAGFDRVFSQKRYEQAKKKAGLSVNEVLTLIQGQPPTAEDIIQHMVCAVPENQNAFQETCNRFFDVIRGMTQEELQKLLLFVTSSDVVPKFESPSYQIQVRVLSIYEDPETAYPTSYTCFKVIRLFYVPDESDQDFRNKIMIAIDSPQGEYYH